MADLYPTKTRLALLRDIASDEVALLHDEYRHDDGRKVNAAVGEQIEAGWAEIAPRMFNDVFRRVRATERGYALLAEHFPEWRGGQEARP